MQNPQFLLFPDFKPKALTFSYDDGVKEDIRLVEIFRKNKLKATFNLNSYNLGKTFAGREILSAEEALSLYGTDMEIAAHGARHLTPTKTPTPLLARDILADRTYLERLFHKIVRGYAYPAGKYNEETVELVADLGFSYARTVDATNSFALPESWLALNPTCHHGSPELQSLIKRFTKPFKETDPTYWISSPKLFYVWGHSYELSEKDNWEVVENFCEIMGRQKDVWFATNGEIYKYLEAFDRLIFSIDLSFVENPTSTDVYLKINGKKVVATAKETTKL